MTSSSTSIPTRIALGASSASASARASAPLRLTARHLHTQQLHSIHDLLPPSLALPDTSAEEWPQSKKRRSLASLHFRNEQLALRSNHRHFPLPSSSTAKTPDRTSTAPQQQRQQQQPSHQTSPPQTIGLPSISQGRPKRLPLEASLRKQRLKAEENRIFLILRLIQQRRIVSAMTAFFADLKAQRSPFTRPHYEYILVALRRTVQQTPDIRPSGVGRHPNDSSPIWAPPQLPTGVDPRSLPIVNQCILAMAEVWEACVNSGITPSNRSISALISTLSDHLPPGHVLQAARLAMDVYRESHAGMTPEEQLRDCNYGVVSALMIALGKGQKPEAGEEMLNRWAAARSGSSASPPTPSRPFARAASPSYSQLASTVERLRGPAVPTSARLADICLTEWTYNVDMWNALIQSRINAGDIRGAEAWLERYRLLFTASEETCASLGIKRTRTPSPQPYVRLMRAYAHEADLGTPRLQKKVHYQVQSVLEFMHADHIRLDQEGVVFVARFLAEIGKLRQSVTLLKRNTELLALSAVSPDFPSTHLFKTLFQLYGNIERVSRDHQPLLSWRNQLLEFAPLRETLARFLDAGTWQKTGRANGVHTYRQIDLVNAALEACLYRHDFAAAIVLLNTFQSWQLEPNSRTHSIVVQGIAREKPELFVRFAGEPGFGRPIKVTQTLIATTDDLLQLYQAEGGRWAEKERLEALRQMLDANAKGKAREDEPVSISVKAKPLGPRTLREMDHLVKLLEGAIVAEVDAAGEKDKEAPQWARRVLSTVEANGADAADRAQRIADEAVRRAKSAMLSRKTLTSATARHDAMAASPSGRPILGRVSQRPVSAVPPAGTVPSLRSLSTSCSGSSRSPLKYAHLPPIRVEHLPHQVPYSLGLALQEHLVARRGSARALLRSVPAPSPSASQIEESEIIKQAREIASTDTLLLLEHKPVYTEGRREGKEDTAVSTALRNLGADYYVTKRGGQITYHGPGQLMGYPILDIGAMEMSIRCYVDRIQDSLKHVLASNYGLQTVPPPEDHTGVWADEYHKIASIGIQVRHRITSHGFALNVEQRSMRGFQYIVACGIQGRSMTCIEQELGRQLDQPLKERKVDMRKAVECVKDGFGEVFGRTIRGTEDGEFEYVLGEEEVERALKGLRIEKWEGESFVKGITVDGETVVVP